MKRPCDVVAGACLCKYKMTITSNLTSIFINDLSSIVGHSTMSTVRDAPFYHWRELVKFTWRFPLWSHRDGYLGGAGDVMTLCRPFVTSFLTSSAFYRLRPSNWTHFCKNLGKVTPILSSTLSRNVDYFWSLTLKVIIIGFRFESEISLEY